MELKYSLNIRLTTINKGSNRTFMELKFSIFYPITASLCSNRTFMELKLFTYIHLPT